MTKARWTDAHFAAVADIAVTIETTPAAARPGYFQLFVEAQKQTPDLPYYYSSKFPNVDVMKKFRVALSEAYVRASQKKDSEPVVEIIDVSTTEDILAKLKNRAGAGETDKSAQDIQIDALERDIRDMRVTIFSLTQENALLKRALEKKIDDTISPMLNRLNRIEGRLNIKR